MKKRNLLLSLALTLTFTACASNQTSQNPVSEETITAALDNDTKALDDPKKDESTSNNEATKEEKSDPDYVDTDKWRRMITEIGEFSPTVAKNLSEEQIKGLVKDARAFSEETGYWDVKDFLFQDLGKMYPELSAKFPLQSIEDKYYQQAAKAGEITDKYEYERRVMADWGYPAEDVWNVDDKDIEEAFAKAYEEDEEAYYEDYVERAAEILFESEEEVADEESETAENTEATNTSKKQQLRRFGSSQVDYDALKSALVQYYEFSPSIVNQITNEDIDIAYTRAMDRLEETGFGDIGLIFDELGKMYPGASTMYPGE